MAQIDTNDIRIEAGHMTIHLGDRGTVSAQVRVRVDTETGEVTLHTDPADLTPPGTDTSTPAAV